MFNNSMKIAAGVVMSAAIGWGGAATMSVAGGHSNIKKGGVLDFVVPAEPPSFDGHRETTFALVHPIAPFYSTLIRVNPDNPSSPTDIVCDLCTEMPTPTDGGKKYTFTLKKGVTFHDGSPLTAQDVKATFDKIIFPPEGVASARKGFYSYVKSVSAPDDQTIVFELEYPTSAFIPALAAPFNFIYQKVKLDQDIRWYEKNVLGSGPFMNMDRQPGAYIAGVKNPNYYHDGKPYLDGFKATFAKKQSLRVQAIRGGRAMAEFRGFPPKSRDDLVNALGDGITVQESDWNCVLLVTPNHKSKPMDDARVRRALTLAVDRWGGSQYLSKIAIVKTVGGIVFPSHPLAATKEELEKIPGYWPDLKKSREEAKRLLKEAGHENLKITMNNRAVDQPYKIVGTWLIGQWKEIGVEVEQRVQPTGPFYATLRKKKDFDISIDFNCQTVVNPLADTSKFISEDVGSSQHGQFIDRKSDDYFNKINRETDPAKQRALMREWEMYHLGEQANSFITLWWYRIIPHSSKMKGWKISPSHYLNQDLSNIWLDQ